MGNYIQILLFYIIVAVVIIVTVVFATKPSDIPIPIVPTFQLSGSCPAFPTGEDSWLSTFAGNVFLAVYSSAPDRLLLSRYATNGQSLFNLYIQEFTLSISPNIEVTVFTSQGFTFIPYTDTGLLLRIDSTLTQQADINLGLSFDAKNWIVYGNLFYVLYYDAGEYSINEYVIDNVGDFTLLNTVKTGITIAGTTTQLVDFNSFVIDNKAYLNNGNQVWFELPSDHVIRAFGNGDIVLSTSGNKLYFSKRSSKNFIISTIQVSGIDLSNYPNYNVKFQLVPVVRYMNRFPPSYAVVSVSSPVTNITLLATINLTKYSVVNQRTLNNSNDAILLYGTSVVRSTLANSFIVKNVANGSTFLSSGQVRSVKINLKNTSGNFIPDIKLSVTEITGFTGDIIAGTGDFSNVVLNSNYDDPAQGKFNITATSYQGNRITTVINRYSWDVSVPENTVLDESCEYFETSLGSADTPIAYSSFSSKDRTITQYDGTVVSGTGRTTKNGSTGFLNLCTPNPVEADGSDNQRVISGTSMTSQKEPYVVTFSYNILPLVSVIYSDTSRGVYITLTSEITNFYPAEYSVGTFIISRQHIQKDNTNKIWVWQNGIDNQGQPLSLLWQLIQYNTDKVESIPILNKISNYLTGSNEYIPAAAWQAPPIVLSVEYGSEILPKFLLYPYSIVDDNNTTQGTTHLTFLLPSLPFDNKIYPELIPTDSAGEKALIDIGYTFNPRFPKLTRYTQPVASFEQLSFDASKVMAVLCLPGNPAKIYIIFVPQAAELQTNPDFQTKLEIVASFELTSQGLPPINKANVKISPENIIIPKVLAYDTSINMLYLHTIHTTTVTRSVGFSGWTYKRWQIDLSPIV